MFLLIALTKESVTPLTLIAVLLLKTPESIETPCSVNTYGKYLLPPALDFEVPFWHLKSYDFRFIRIEVLKFNRRKNGYYESRIFST